MQGSMSLFGHKIDTRTEEPYLGRLAKYIVIKN